MKLINTHEEILYREYSLRSDGHILVSDVRSMNTIFTTTKGNKHGN